MTLHGEDKNENGNLTMEMLRLVNDCMETYNAIKTALNLPSVFVDWFIVYSTWQNICVVEFWGEGK